MNLLKKLSFFTWNIGFLNLSEEELITRKSLGDPVWLKHGFRDRFFADPFFLSIDGKTAKVLVEEEIFIEGKGRLVCLTCDMETGKLLDRKVVLELPTHLSYPQIIREESRGGGMAYPRKRQRRRTQCIYLRRADRHRHILPKAHRRTTCRFNNVLS